MADNQNVTLGVPRDLLKRAKCLVADRDTSVSALVTEALLSGLMKIADNSAARKRALAAMKRS